MPLRQHKCLHWPLRERRQHYYSNSNLTFVQNSWNKWVPSKKVPLQHKYLNWPPRERWQHNCCNLNLAFVHALQNCRNMPTASKHRSIGMSESHQKKNTTIIRGKRGRNYNKNLAHKILEHARFGNDTTVINAQRHCSASGLETCRVRLGNDTTAINAQRHCSASLETS
jgi:hypothetical protein